jgi:DNA polymerase alpha subunit A
MANLLGDLDSAPSAPLPIYDLPSKKRKSDLTSYRDSPIGPSSDGISKGSETGPSSGPLAPSSDPTWADDLHASRENKKPRKSEDVFDINPMDDFDFDNFSNDWGDDVQMADAQQSNGKAKVEVNDDDIFTQPLLPRDTNSRTTSTTRRALVNSASIKPSNPVVAPISDTKSQVNGEDKKPKGMDWQEAAAKIAIVSTSSDPIEELPPLPAAAKRNVASASAQPLPSSSKVDALDASGTLRFFWLDYLEVNGILHLFGKVWDKSSARHVSCCVTVEGIERNLYVLRKGSKPAATKSETGEDGQYLPRLPNLLVS